MESINLTTGEVFTIKEIPRLLNQIDIQNQIIKDYEKQICSMVNHIFQLGKEIHICTEEVFNNPLMNAKEWRV